MARNDFATSFRRFIDNSKRKAERRIERTVGYVFAKTAITSPSFWTGRYWANWKLTVGSLEGAVFNPYGYEHSPSAELEPERNQEWRGVFAPVIARNLTLGVDAMSNDFRLGDTINIENSLWYALDNLEYGGACVGPERCGFKHYGNLFIPRVSDGIRSGLTITVP